MFFIPKVSQRVVWLKTPYKIGALLTRINIIRKNLISRRNIHSKTKLTTLEKMRNKTHTGQTTIIDLKRRKKNKTVTKL